MDLDNCVHGTINLLEAMVKFGCKRLMFASTAAVYGTATRTGQPMDETYGPLHPISHYGAAKLACEAFISSYSHLHDLQSTIFRFGNVVGGGMDHGIIYDLIARTLANRSELKVWGNGQGFKPFFLVDDCVWGMGMMLDREPALHSPSCETFVLGNHTYTQIRRVVEIVLAVMQQTELITTLPEVVYGETAQGFKGDVPIVTLDPSEMSSYGWTCCTSDEAVRTAALLICQDFK